MNNSVTLFANGQRYDLPDSEVANFRKTAEASNIPVEDGQSFRTKSGETYTLPSSQIEAFRAAAPDAESVRPFRFSDNSTKYMTMPEMSRFLRSKEWREGDEYKADREERDRAVNAKLGEDGEMHSPAWAGVKGALKGAVQGAWEGGNAAANKIAKAIPEIGVSLESALGNALNLGGNAPNAVGNWFLANAASGKAWLDAKLPDQAKDWVGYEDWSTKTADKFADVSAMAYKFAPAMATGGSTSLVNTMFASDGINAASQTFDNAMQSGFTPGEANKAAAASFLVNFYGAKLMTRAGGVADNIANPLLRLAGGAAGVGTTMGVQSAANRGIENVTSGRPFAEGMGEAFEEGNIEGLMFHGINAIPGAVIKTGDRMRESREAKEYRRDSLLEVARGEDGGEFLNALLSGEGLDAAVRARKSGVGVSRKIGERAGLPDNMSAAERNEVIDAIIKARGERAAQNAVKVDGFRADALDAAIKEVGGEGEVAQDIRARVIGKLKNARELDDPFRREELVGEAFEEWNKEHKQEKPNETGNVPDEKPAQPKPPVETRAEGAEAVRPVEGEPPRGEAPREGVVKKRKFASVIAEEDPDNPGKTRYRIKVEGEDPQKHGYIFAESAEEAEKLADRVEADRQIRADAPKAKLSDGTEVFLVKEEKGWVARQMMNGMRADGGVYSPGKTKDAAIKNAEKYITSAARPPQGSQEPPAPPKTGEDTPAPTEGVETASRASDAKPVPDGKGKLVKPKKEKTARREPQDVSALNEAIKEAKTVAKGGENRLFEVKVGTTTVKFLSNEKGIEHAEKMAKTLSTVKDWSPKHPESKTPSAPKPLKVAKGKNLAGFDDISKEYVSKGKNARTGLTKPIVKDGMVYATDGRSIIRMPAEGAADTKDAPDVAKVYPENRKGKVLENFTFNPSESHVGLEQASALTSKDGTVEMWRSPTGEIMFRSRVADSAWEPSSTSSFVGSSLKDADLIGSFNPDYLSKAFQTLAKLGVKDAEVEWRGATSALYIKGGDAEILIMPKHSGKVDADTTVQLLGGKRRLTDAGRAAALEEEIKVEQERAKARDPEITQASLDQIAKRYRDNEAKVAEKIKESGGKQDPLYSRAPEENVFEPEQEIEERLDLKRIDPKRRGDPKVLAWAKKNGRNVTNGVVTPDAVRAYDEAMTENTGRLVKRWFPDMKIVAHKYGEKIKRGQHVIEQKAEGAATHAAEALSAIADGKPYGILHNEKYGEIQYPLGKIGKEKQSGKTKGGFGFLHIVAERMKKDGATLDEAIDVARRVGVAAEIGTETRSVMNTHWLDHDGVRAIIAIKEDGKPIITGYEIRADGDLAAFPPSKPLQSRPVVREGDIVAALRERIAQHSAEVNGGTEKNYLRDTSGGVLGWFDPKSKEVHLLPGADPKTVAHEIMWHGTRDYISQLAAKGDRQAQKFLDMMHDVEQNIPAALKQKIIGIYTKGTKAPSSDTLMNEFGAWFTMEKGGAALEKALQKAENRDWFAKAFYTVKEMYKDFLTRHGRNRVDLSAIDGMTRDEFVDFVAKEFAGGKTLGEITGKADALSTKETKLQAYRRKVYDNNAPVRDLERDIEKKTGKKIAADDSVEAANALKYGLKEAANIEIQGKMANFRKTLDESGIHYEDLEYYAALKAAAGRDAKIDKRNIDKLTEDMKKAGASAQDIADAIADYKSTNGSHIDPREAKKMLAEIENGPDAAKYKAAYDKLRAIIDETLDTQVAAGLVDAKDAAQWRTEEPNYVPFKNEYDPESGDWEGRGTSRNFVQSEHRMAKGRQSAAGDIIAHVFMDHQAAKHRAIENDVRKKLAELVRANPEIGKVELLRKESVKNIEKDDPNVVVFKDGGRSYAIRLNGTRGAAIANAFTQRNLANTKWADYKPVIFGRKISYRDFAQWSSGMATRYSLTFSVRNTTKDNIELANIVYNERGPIEGTKFMANYVKNRAKMSKTLWRWAATGEIDTTTAEGQILDRYIKAGGLIAGGVQAEGLASIKAKLDPKAIAKEMKKGKSKTPAAVKHFVKSLSTLNEYAEYATRLGVFATEIKAGKSDAEAALFARRATVDFNRHGDYTPNLNLIRMFSNSNIGALARAGASFSKSRYGKAMWALLFGKGLALSLIDYFANKDEDERRRKTGEATGKDISEYDRKSSFLYFRKGDNLYKIGQHKTSPFSFVSYAGDCFGRWLCGEIDLATAAKNLGVDAAELAFVMTGLGDINLTSRKGDVENNIKAAFVSGFVPSPLQAAAEVLLDIDYKGDNLERKRFDDNDPKSYNGKENTPEWAKSAAISFNDATGGSEGRRGWFDISPEAVQKLVEGYGKNAMRDVSGAYSVFKAIAGGKVSELDPRNTPFVRDFVRPLDGNDRRFNDALSQYKADKHEFDKMESRWTEDERRAYKKAHPWVADKSVKNAVSEIQKLRKMEQGFSYKTGKATPYEWSKEEIEEFKKERRELQAFVLEKMRK